LETTELDTNPNSIHVARTVFDTATTQTTYVKILLSNYCTKYPGTKALVLATLVVATIAYVVPAVPGTSMHHQPVFRLYSWTVLNPNADI